MHADNETGRDLAVAPGGNAQKGTRFGVVYGAKFELKTHWKTLQDRLPIIAYAPEFVMPAFASSTLPPQPLVTGTYRIANFSVPRSEVEILQALYADSAYPAGASALLALAASDQPLHASTVIVALGTKTLIENRPHAPALFVNKNFDRGIFLYPLMPETRLLPNSTVDARKGDTSVLYWLDGLEDFLPRMYFPANVLFLVQCLPENDFGRRR